MNFKQIAEKLYNMDNSDGPRYKDMSIEIQVLWINIAMKAISNELIEVVDNNVLIKS